MPKIKLDKSKYNVTDLNPEKTFERHVYHRDQFAHFMRWTHILKETRIGDVTCDFGCGDGALLEVLYRNRFKQKKYVGIDIRDKFKPDLKRLDWAEFIVEDLVNPQLGTDFASIQADHVVSFEVIEHVGRQNAPVFLKNFMACGNEDATYYLSTPNYDLLQGAAGNHTYDSGDGRGIAPHEFLHKNLEKEILDAGFKIIKKYGTFASIKDYKHKLNDWQEKMFAELRGYYDTNLLANLMAPFFPEQSRNCMWILKRK